MINGDYVKSNITFKRGCVGQITNITQLPPHLRNREWTVEVNLSEGQKYWFYDHELIPASVEEAMLWILENK